MRPATACGRRCWRRTILPDRRSRSTACRATITRSAKRRICRDSPHGLGESWEIMPTSYKPYPCGFVVHPVIDCVLDWRREHPAAVVEKVVVTGNPLMAARADRPDISTGRESQVSVQHAVAAALTLRQGRPRTIHRCLRARPARAGAAPARSAWCATQESSDHRRRCRDHDGRRRHVHNLTQHAARGSDANPMSDRDLEEKLRDAASSWNPRHDIAPLIEAIWRSTRATDVSRLAAMTVPRG